MQETSVDDWSDADREPTAAELAAIEAEQPVLAAEFALIEAHAAVQERPTVRAARRVRRAAVRLLAAHRARAHEANALVRSGLVPPERWGWAR